LEKIASLSGRMASVYTVVLASDSTSMLEEFVEIYASQYPDEVDNILMRLRAIGHKVGARRQYFKENEGRYDDMVCALYDEPEKQLRLYCIRIGSDFIIIGGGGPKQTRTWQEDTNLSFHVNAMMAVSAGLTKKLHNRDLVWISGGMDLDGNLDFNDEHE